MHHVAMDYLGYIMDLVADDIAKDEGNAAHVLYLNHDEQFGIVDLEDAEVWLVTVQKAQLTPVAR